MSEPTRTHDPEAAVAARYSAGAQAREEALCCPVSFDPSYLEVLPTEILERDYGCGDPTPFVREGDVVLDLGSGAGKVCWIAAQKVGPTGRVIGIDMNTEMLALARSHHAEIAERVGFDNVEYHRARIQDLRLDLDRLDEPSRSPMIADDSVDIIVSNCVLNLVRPDDKAQLFGEMYRVLKRGGRVAISDIVADEDVPQELQDDPELWSGCISGAYREDAFLQAFIDAGFHGVEIVSRDEQPWRTVAGIEFRSITVQASKGKDGPCLERNQAVVYRGPFSRVHDDDGHVYLRGERTAVCDKTFHLLQREPYRGMFVPIPPHEEVALDTAETFDCDGPRPRHPRETKGEGYDATSAAKDSVGGPDGCC